MDQQDFELSDDNTNDTMTVAEAKEEIEAHLDEGIACRCCGRPCRRYPRQIYWTMAMALISLYKLTKRFPEKDYFHIKPIYEESRRLGHPIICGDFAKFNWWGLIEEREKDPEDKTKRTDGFWRLTEVGKRFVEGKELLPKVAHIYHNTFQGYSLEMVDIRDCIKKQFNYDELMGGEAA